MPPGNCSWPILTSVGLSVVLGRAGAFSACWGPSSEDVIKKTIVLSPGSGRALLWSGGVRFGWHQVTSFICFGCEGRGDRTLIHPLPGGSSCSNRQAAATQYQTKPRLGAGQKKQDQVKECVDKQVFSSWPRAEQFSNEPKQSLKILLRTSLLPRGPKTGKYTTFV